MVNTWDYFHRRQAWDKFVLTSFLEMQSVNAGSVRRQPDSYIPKVEELQKNNFIFVQFVFNEWMNEWTNEWMKSCILLSKV